MEKFVIKTEADLLKKMEMCNTMMGIVIAHTIEKKGKGKPKTGLAPNPADSQYENLKCKITPMNENSENYKMAKHYFENGMDRGGWGDSYKIIHAFEVDREGEKAKFNPDKLKERKLLWHGSRFSNFSGILSQGLKVAPPEAPSTGHKFGKGIYFADLSGLSICFSQIGLSNN
jgi:poly [ADP-ribose] polymerase